MLSFWGLAGAFIYAGPRWVISLAEKPDSGRYIVISTIELLIALVVGTLAASAFGPIAAKASLTTMGLQDDNATHALIGLFVNRLAPMAVDRGANALSSGADMFGKVFKALKADDK